jgi:predicted ATPase
MVSKIELVNFKSHKETKINLRNLTILCGSNGVGKSSLIQILLLLREAFLKDKSFDILDLKSNPIKIGTASDAIYEFAEFDGFKITLTFNEIKTCIFQYDAISEDDKSKSFIRLKKNNQEFENIEQDNSLFNFNFQYISAARLGPQEQYPKDDKIVDVHKQISVIEGKAEYFVHFLDKYRNQDVINELCYPNEHNYRDLYTQVTLWEKHIFNGANTEVQDVGKLGYLLKYSFDNEKSTTKRTKSFDAKNVGFGLTYTLPIIVSILSAQKGSLLIIENPEAHLHPGGIARLTELICLAAQAGIQIIIETHSDHVINGVLVQSKQFEVSEPKTGIDKKNVSIYQILRDDKEHYSIAIPIQIEEGGRIYEKPAGFFDQISNDLRELI